ncbi:GNAT family N-acetyltransferase [Exiguobacterium sp. s150]|uniref:GNAT family N-acetyltransferase n=1 Tax=Exiguobacterium sp. s150 TaxID=2751221 RepID=UPI001BE91F93|nr:GNAT family N-acetyltransferase [Exiguobacterium sp. s150]
MQPHTYICNGRQCTIRLAKTADAKQLESVRLQIDGETEYLDREPGESYLDVHVFERLIHIDCDTDNHVFLVAEVDHQVVGFARCEGTSLKRKAHVVEFGVGVLQAYWGLGLGSALLRASIYWADANHIYKISLSVLSTNEKAVALYERYGFEVEGRLRHDKRLRDVLYYDTILMGRLNGV